MSQQEQAGHNRLAVLAAGIHEAHAEVRRCAQATVEHAIAAGHMLVEAKASLPHGAWAAWLTENTGLSARTAQRYMRIARSGLKTATVAHLGIRGAAEAIAKAIPPTSTLFRSGSKYLILDPPHAGDATETLFLRFVLVDTATDEVTYIRRGIREDFLSTALRHQGFDISESAEEPLSSCRRSDLLNAIGLTDDLEEMPR